MSDRSFSRPESSKIPPEIGELLGEGLHALLRVGSDHRLSSLRVKNIAKAATTVQRSGTSQGMRA
jgi:hypothetical protein